MDQSDFELLTPFDKLISSKQLQMLKLMIPYAPPQNQRTLAVYTKFLELQYTMDYFGKFQSDLHTQAFEKATFTPMSMLDELRPYLPERIRNSLDSILNVFNMMEMISTMEKVNSNENSDAGGFNPIDIMKGMLTPEQQNMFEMYSTMFNEAVDPDSKGEPENG